MSNHKNESTRPDPDTLLAAIKEDIFRRSKF
jgi:hypothetical protein